MERAFHTGGAPAITDREFALFREMIYRKAGIALSPAKKPLVAGRLIKRLRHHGLASFGDYYRLLESGRQPGEFQTAVDLLTTNETYFFREPRHFDFLSGQIMPRVTAGQNFRVWSAASSSGEEAYSAAMLLAEGLGNGPWEVVGTDICTRVLERARSGLYPLERQTRIPPHYLTRHCLRGIGSQEGTFLVDSSLRGRVRFLHANLIEHLPDIGVFDVIFLRNVLIYFDAETKRQVAARVAERIKPGGYLFVGHAESLNGVVPGLQTVQPSIYRRLER